jgi:hypothetical protein
MTWLAFIAGLLVLFGVAVSVGETIGPRIGGEIDIPGGDQGSDSPQPNGTDGGPNDGKGDPVGLSVADRGYVLRPTASRFVSGESVEFRFTVFTLKGEPVKQFSPDLERRMQLILIRRDLSGYQRIHPILKGIGEWRAQVLFPEPGSYRAFATFLPKNVAEPVTLGVDLMVPGDVEPDPVTQSSNTDELDDGYSVMREGILKPGTVSRIYLHVLHDDVPVGDLQPISGDVGRLVMIREGDLGFLQVHPVDGPRQDTTVSFRTDLPTAGYYRLFFDFQHRGVTRTAEFTVLVS